MKRGRRMNSAAAKESTMSDLNSRIPEFRQCDGLGHSKVRAARTRCHKLFASPSGRPIGTVLADFRGGLDCGRLEGFGSAFPRMMKCLHIAIALAGLVSVANASTNIANSANYSDVRS